MSCHAISTLGAYDQNFSNIVSTKCHFLPCYQIQDSKSFLKSPRTRESKFGRERYGHPELECNRGHTIAPIHVIVCPRVARTFWKFPYTQVFNPNSFRKKPFRPATTPCPLRPQNGSYSNLYHKTCHKHGTTWSQNHTKTIAQMIERNQGRKNPYLLEHSPRRYTNFTSWSDEFRPLEHRFPFLLLSLSLSSPSLSIFFSSLSFLSFPHLFFFLSFPSCCSLLL